MSDDPPSPPGLTGANGQAPVNQQASPQDRMQRREAYTVIAPDPSKRDSVAAQAQRGEEMYKQHKENKKVGHVSYVGSVGGGMVNEDGARQRSQQDQRTAKQKTWDKSHAYKQEARQREQAEFDKKKAEARKKAIENECQDVNRQQTLSDHHRRSNDAFLARIEQQNKQHVRQKILQSSTAKTMASSEPAAAPARVAAAGVGVEQLQQQEAGPGRYGWGSADCDQQQQHAGDQGQFRDQQRYGPQFDQGAYNQWQAESSEDNDTELPFPQLEREYPQFDADVLEAILSESHGDVETARMILDTMSEGNDDPRH